MESRMYGQIHLADGSVEYVADADIFARLIRERLGFDAEEIVRELIRQADYETHKAESDLGAYERELEGARFSFEDIYDTATRIRSELERRKTNKQEVMRLLGDIRAIASDYL